MASASGTAGDITPAKVNIFYDPVIRGYVYQAVTVLALVGIIYEVWSNALENMKRANIASGFDFLTGRAGFDIGQSLIEYSSDSSYMKALEVGIYNTLLVAVCGIVTATIIGMIIGLGRLSRNWLISRLCTVYVEVFRNLPPLLVIFFWYSGVLNALPQAKNSIELPFDTFLNNRGLFFPKPVFGDGFSFVVIALVLALVLAFAISRWAHNRQMATGQQFPALWVSLVLIVALPLIVFFGMGSPLSFDIPVAGKFNLTGGSVIGPEFMSLYLALSVYTASFIAEIIRSGINGVAKGQSEAAGALGLRSGQTMRLIVLPQSLRIIIPQISSEYLGITKNTSLAVAIGYADFVAVGGTILNQTGHSIEIVVIWMVVFLGISLATSMFMNWFNSKMALVER